MTNLYADTGFPEGLSRHTGCDLDLVQLSARLGGRTIVAVTFGDGNFVLKLDDGTTVTARGNAVEDHTMTLQLRSQDSQTGCDLDHAQLSTRLGGRTIAAITFDDGNFVLKLDDAATVTARGSPVEDHTMTLQLESPDVVG